MLVLQLTGAPFFGGPERLMLGLAQSLPASCRTAFALLADRGSSQTFRRRLLEHRLEAITLAHDTPHLPAMVALKILEAMAAGLPVLSTRVGAEGLELVPGRDYILADEPETMARELVSCIRDPGQVRVMAQQSRALVLDRYDWDSLANRLERTWYSCLGN